MTRKLERLGLIGDIHAEDTLLATAISFLEARGVDVIATTGDVADGIGDVNACCQLVETHGLVAVRGNHDRWLLNGSSRSLPGATPVQAVHRRSFAFLERLPTTVELDTVGGRAVLCHGLGTNDMAKVGADDYGYALESNEDLQGLLTNQKFRWILHGHSHRPLVRHFGRVTLINAGTIQSDHEPAFLEIDFRIGEVNRFLIENSRTSSSEPHRTSLAVAPFLDDFWMTPSELLTRYSQGVRDFQGIEVRTVDEGAEFRGCKLDKVDFGGAAIAANFSGASLRGASFRESNLKTCVFDDCILCGADFTGAALCATSFHGANLVNARFEGAYFHSHVLGADEIPNW